VAVSRPRSHADKRLCVLRALGLGVVGVIGNYLDGLGPVWGTMLGLSVFGLTIMGVAAVLGYRDPLSPWQLAKRIRKVSLRANRFAEEWSGDQGSAEGWMWS
jgi:hypothetical protein